MTFVFTEYMNPGLLFDPSIHPALLQKMTLLIFTLVCPHYRPLLVLPQNHDTDTVSYVETVGLFTRSDCAAQDVKGVNY